MNFRSRLREKGVQVIHVLGFQTKEVVFYEENLLALGETYIATVDGTYGTKGFVTDVIDELGTDLICLIFMWSNSDVKSTRKCYTDKKVLHFIRRTNGLWNRACFACVCRYKQIEWNSI